MSYLSKQKLIFDPAFYKCISDTENPFDGSLNKHASLLLGFEQANHVLSYLSSGSLEKGSVVLFKYDFVDLRDKEKFAIKKNQNSPEILREYLAILAAGKLDAEKQESS